MQSIEKKKHSRVIPLLCVILVVLVVCIVYLAVNNSGSSPILKNHPLMRIQLKIIFEGIETKDVELVKSAFHGAHLNYMPSNFSDNKMDRVYGKLSSQYGDDFKISYKNK